MNAPRGKSSGTPQKVKKEKNNANIQKIFAFISTDLDDPSISLITEYIENISKECEFAKKLYSFDIHECPIWAQ